MAESRGIQLRGYRRVFRIERRLFRFDRWRIPYPHGIPLRGIAYFLAIEVGVALAARLPLAGAFVSLWHPSITYLGLPLAGTFALMQARIDGRPPHHVAISLLSYWLGPRCLAGLCPCPGKGEEVVPLDNVTVAFDAREAFEVRGRIKGPARVTFRYPSVGRVEGAPLWLRDPESRRARARRYRIRRVPGARPLLRGKVVAVPRGREVVVE